MPFGACFIDQLLSLSSMIIIHWDICKLTFAPGQILSGDGNYWCKSCHYKVKRNKVPCHAAADKLLIELSQISSWKLETFIIMEFRDLETLTSVCQSRVQKLHFQKS